ncbi:MAG: hypothetical protein M1833_001359 [Piccolia ochrophora]|nr:MAG: hypothetical protein M1833_001359 [Piccolia ochrophora]
MENAKTNEQEVLEAVAGLLGGIVKASTVLAHTRINEANNIEVETTSLEQSYDLVQAINTLTARAKEFADAVDGGSWARIRKYSEHAMQTFVILDNQFVQKDDIITEHEERAARKIVLMGGNLHTLEGNVLAHIRPRKRARTASMSGGHSDSGSGGQRVKKSRHAE